MQSCLEFTSMDARHIQEARSDYQRNNQYSATHPDALASSGNGKGTGHGGHTHWLPNCRGTIGIINYSNFDTDIRSGAGNDCDNTARQFPRRPYRKPEADLPVRQRSAGRPCPRPHRCGRWAGRARG